jgi:hypothetical protein
MNLIVLCQAINLNIIDSVLHIIANLVNSSVKISMITFAHSTGGVGWVSHSLKVREVLNSLDKLATSYCKGVIGWISYSLKARELLNWLDVLAISQEVRGLLNPLDE